MHIYSSFMLVIGCCFMIFYYVLKFIMLKEVLRGDCES